MKLRLQNFRPFADVDVDFQDTPGVVVIYGDNRVADYADSNGVGKTALVQGVLWTFFGKYPGLSGANKVMKRGLGRGTKTIGEVHHRDRHGNPLHIVRTRSKSSIDIQVNGQSWDADHAQGHIDDLLGIDYDRFVKCCVFTGDFNFAGQSDAPMKALLSTLTPVDLDRALPVANHALSAAKQAEATHAARVEASSTLIGKLRTDWENAQGNLTEWEKTRARSVEHYQNEQQIALATHKAAHQEMAAAEAALLQLTSPTGYSEARAAYDTLVAEESAASLRVSTAQQNWQRNKLATEEPAPGMTCGTCAQDLPAPHRLRLTQAHQGRIEIARQELAAAQGELDQHSAALQDVSHRVVASKAHLDAFALPDTSAAQARVDTARAAATNADENLRTVTDSLVTWRGSANPHSESVTLMGRQLTEATEAHPGLLAEYQKAEADVVLYQYLATLCSKKGLSHFALQQLLPWLTHDTNLFLSQMSPEHLRAFFRSETERGAEKFHCLAESAVGAQGYTELSAGERRRIDGSAFLALYELTVRTVTDFGAIFLDELLDASMDRSGKAAMLRMLCSYAQERGRVVFVITNDETVLSDRRYVSKVLRVTRQDDTSTIAEI